MRALNKRLFAFTLAAIVSLLMFFLNPLTLDHKANMVFSIAVLMIVLWISEALPMPVVALLPLILFPFAGISKLDEVSVSYSNPVIFLFMGGFMIGLAIEKWNLHKRIALAIVTITGTGGNRIVLGFILATGFLSMWLSNTATTMMMFPIALSVISIIEQHHKGKGEVSHVAIPIMLSIAYASSFGGMATIIGTPPNVAYVAFLKKKYDLHVQFSDWMIICTPLAFLLMIALYLLMTKVLYPNHLRKDQETRLLIAQEVTKLGKMTKPEVRVAIIFGLTAFFWITKDIINNNIHSAFQLDDTIIALTGAVLLFLCPSGSANGSKQLLVWDDTSKMAWGILLLFGGGIALAAQLEKAGLIQTLGVWLSGFAGDGGFMLVIVIAVISIFVSEVMSNVAQVIVFAPVISAIADSLGMNPLLLGLPMTLAASAACMMPMGTPPNAIVFASGKLKLRDMVLTGFVMNIVAIILISLFSWFLIPLLIKV